MLTEPQVTRCGFCGEQVTILEDVAICPSCNSIVARPEEGDENLRRLDWDTMPEDEDAEYLDEEDYTEVDISEDEAEQ